MKSKLINRYISFLFILLCTGNVLAQTNTENFSDLEFDFSRIGARAAGMGDVFISIADDPTSVEANPAGLARIKRPGLLLEVRGSATTQKIFNFSHIGSPEDFTLSEGRFLNSGFNPSIFSLVYPLNNLTISVFRLELMNIENSFFTRGAFVPGFTDGTSYSPTTSHTNMKIVNWGGAAGYRLSSQLFVGISTGISRLDVDSNLSRYRVEIFDERALKSRVQINDKDEDLFVNVGIQYRLLENLTVGGVVKLRPSFTVNQAFETVSFPEDSSRTEQIHFNIPRSYGIGLSYRPFQALLFGIDLVRINYSSLVNDFIITESPDVLSQSDYSASDGTELHLGTEYAGTLGFLSYSVRAGVFTVPDNQIRFTGSSNENADRQLQETFFQGGDREAHYSLGLGLGLKDIFRIDLAYVFSEKMDEFFASVRYGLN